MDRIKNVQQQKNCGMKQHKATRELFECLYFDLSNKDDLLLQNHTPENIINQISHITQAFNIGLAHTPQV